MRLEVDGILEDWRWTLHGLEKDFIDWIWTRCGFYMDFID
jgi:hypothetical protein